MATTKPEGDVTFAPVDTNYPPPPLGVAGAQYPYNTTYGGYYQWGYYNQPTYYVCPPTYDYPYDPSCQPIFRGDAVEVRSEHDGSAGGKSKAEETQDKQDQSAELPPGCYIPYHPAYSHESSPGVHICSQCQQVRSVGYHRDHPIAPGATAEHSMCRKCKRKSTPEGLDGAKDCKDTIRIEIEDDGRGRARPCESYRIVTYRARSAAKTPGSDKKSPKAPASPGSLASEKTSTTKSTAAVKSGHAQPSPKPKEKPNAPETPSKPPSHAPSASRTASKSSHYAPSSKPSNNGSDMYTINSDDRSRTYVKVRERSRVRRRRSHSSDSLSPGPWRRMTITRERSCPPHKQDYGDVQPSDQQSLMSSKASTKAAEGSCDGPKSTSKSTKAESTKDVTITRRALSTAEARLAAHPSAFRYGRYVTSVAPPPESTEPPKQIAASEKSASVKAAPAKPSEERYSEVSVHEYRHRHRHRSRSRHHRGRVGGLDGHADSEASSPVVQYTNSMSSDSDAIGSESRRNRGAARSVSRRGFAQKSQDSMAVAYGGSRVQFESEANAARRHSMITEQGIAAFQPHDPRDKPQKFGISAFVRKNEEDARDPEKDKDIKNWLAKTPPPSPRAESSEKTADVTDVFRHVNAPPSIKPRCEPSSSEKAKTTLADPYRPPINHISERSTHRASISRDRSPSPSRRGRTLRRSQSPRPAASTSRPPALNRKVSFPPRLPENTAQSRRYLSPPPTGEPWTYEFASESTEQDGVRMRRKPSIERVKRRRADGTVEAFLRVDEGVRYVRPEEGEVVELGVPPLYLMSGGRDGVRSVERGRRRTVVESISDEGQV